MNFNRLFILIFLLLSSCLLSFGQVIKVNQLGVYPELAVNQGFPAGNDLICFHDAELFWVHSNGRPMGLENDSLDLFVLNGSKLVYVQTLQTPMERTLSKLTGFGLTDSFLFVTDYNIVLIYKKTNVKFELFEVIDAVNSVTIMTGKYGSFEDWVETESFIFTTDFHVDNSCKGGCKEMFIGKIDKGSLELVDSFSLKTCGNIMAQINSHMPFDFSPSGKFLARVDLPKNIIQIYELGAHELSPYYEIQIDSSDWNGIDTDSLSIWTDIYQYGPYRERQDYWTKLTREVIHSDQITGIMFLSDSILLIRSVKNNVLHLAILNVYNKVILDLETPPELIGQRWENHMMCVHDAKLYVLFPNKVIEEKQGVWKEQGQKIATIKGWRLVELSVN